MSRPLDTVARAYAVIGLRPGASAQELKEQYKRLAKTWHPDRWANDPASEAEAAQRMRMINDAYATLQQAHSAKSTTRTATAPAAAAPAAASHADARPSDYRPLTDDELDALVNAIGSHRIHPVSMAARFLAWFLPMVASVVPIYQAYGIRPTTSNDWTISASLFTGGVLVLVYQKLIKR